MLEGLLKSMLPPDFDLDGFLKNAAVTFAKMQESADQTKENATKLDALIRHLIPDTRPVAAWKVQETKGQMRTFVSLYEPDPTPEEIESGGLVITKLFE